MNFRSSFIASFHATVLALFFSTCFSPHEEASAAENGERPVKALLICGGCCHDYGSQKEIIKKGLEENANIDVTVVHQGGAGTRAEIELYKDPQWAEPYDVILHDECFADDRDPAWLERILGPHRAGKPAVVIHCAMHCYRVGNDDWFEFCGVTSHGHGPHYPHEVRNVNAAHPIMEGFGAAWFNPAGELYRIEKLWETATPLGTAKDRENGKDQVCVWTNDYRGTRVFGTTLGHHNETVEHPTFMRLLTRGTLWAAGKLSDDYLKPAVPRLVPVNLAAGKKVSASSEQTSEKNLLAMATDENRGTRWCAATGSFPQWLQVDLESLKEIEGVEIVWESDGATYQYQIHGSQDGMNFDLLYDSGESGVRGNAADHRFSANNIRYIRVDCLQASPGSWASIREIHVHGKEMRVVEPTSAQGLGEANLLSECRIPDGFDATIFAAPPAVNYPVFVAAATDGTVFVSSDKNGSLDRAARRGSIVRLVDIDGDGRADSSNLYVDDVDSPRGIVWDHDRLYVLHPPHLSAFIDEDGDGVSDRQEVLVKDIAFGFADRPADHTSNGVTLGIDGWLYLAIGDFGFLKATGADGRELQFRGGGVVRVRPDGTGLELYSRGTRNILEVAMDPLLRGFARDNTNDGGGWDIRLHHFTGLEDHGYPRRYIHFADEVIKPLADYGGGSGCGALYMDEPGMPAGYGNALYTADWGRERIFRHHVSDRGATVAVDQEEFLAIPRATDLDVDGFSRIYAASWKGATFTYNGENVGYLIQLRPHGYIPPELLDFESASWPDLVDALRDPSHRRRLEAQRALIRRVRDDQDQKEEATAGLLMLAQDSTALLQSRVAAVFGIKQILGEDAFKSLAQLVSDETIRPYAIRALADRWDEMTPSVTGLIRAGLSAGNSPRTVLESLVAAGRVGLSSRALADQVGSEVTRWFGCEDEVLAHTAIEVAILMQAVDAVVAVIDDPNRSIVEKDSAFRVLQGIPNDHVVARVAPYLGNSDPTIASLAFGSLCRLYHVEGTWNGASWGTRPDTRGPYYQPVTWEQSEPIRRHLSSFLASLDAPQMTPKLMIMAKNRLDISSDVDNWIRKIKLNEVPLESLLSVLAVSEKVPDSAFTILADTDEGELTGTQRTRLAELYLRGDNEVATRGFLRLLISAGTSGDQVGRRALLAEIVGSRSFDRHLPRIRLEAEGDGELASFAATLLALRGLRETKNEKAEVQQLVDFVWGDESRVQGVLQKLNSFDYRDGEGVVRRAMLDPRTAIATLAEEIGKKWGLANMEDWVGPKISDLDPAQVLAFVTETKGDAARGKQVFAVLGCAKCHDVSPTEELRGPYLPNVAKTYKRDQLVESILMPSKSIAQGFVQNVFLLDDGRVIAGFVTAEGATELTVRNSEGVAIQIPVESIEQRTEKTTSVMPEGLANGIPPAALADLITYLESLGK